MNPLTLRSLGVFFLAVAAGVSSARAAAPSVEPGDPRLADALKPAARTANETPEAYLIRVAEAADRLKLPPAQKAEEIRVYHQKCIQQKQNPCANEPLSKPQVAALELGASKQEEREVSARANRSAEAMAAGLKPNASSPGDGPLSAAHPRSTAGATRPAGYAPGSQLPQGFVTHSAAPPNLTVPALTPKPAAGPQGNGALLSEAASVFGALWIGGGDPKALAAASRTNARLQAQANLYTPATTPTATGYGTRLLLKVSGMGLQFEAFVNDPHAELRAAGGLASSAWEGVKSSMRDPYAEAAPKLAQARAAMNSNPTKENKQAYAALRREAVVREIEFDSYHSVPGGPLVVNAGQAMAKGIAKDFTNLWGAGAELVKHPEKRNGWYISDAAAKSIMPIADVAGAVTGVGGLVRGGGTVIAERVVAETVADSALDAANAARRGVAAASEIEQASGRAAAHGDFKALSDINESHSARVRRTEAELAKLQAQAADPGSSLATNRDYQLTLARYKSQRAELDLIRRDMGQSQMDALLKDLAADDKIRIEQEIDPKKFNSDFLNGRQGTPPFGEDITIKKVRVEKDIELCQGHSSSLGKISYGKWFIPCASDVYINDRALRDLIALPDSNGVDSIVRVRIPAGTEFYVGTAGPIRSDTAGRIESMYVNRNTGEAVGGGGHGGYTQIFIDPKAQGKETVADLGLTTVRAVPIPKSNDKILLELSKRWREAYGDPTRAQAVYQDFLAESAKPSSRASADLELDYQRFNRFFCESFRTENPGAAVLPACRP